MACPRDEIFSGVVRCSAFVIPSTKLHGIVAPGNSNALVLAGAVAGWHCGANRVVLFPSPCSAKRKAAFCAWQPPFCWAWTVGTRAA